MAQGRKLAAVTWSPHPYCHNGFSQSQCDNHHAVLLDTELQLQEYFGGERYQFCLPLLTMGTPFQNMVWQALKEIPYGETCSYVDIANLIGKPKAFRAIGAASAADPVAIIVPCG